MCFTIVNCNMWEYKLFTESVYALTKRMQCISLTSLPPRRSSISLSMANTSDWASYLLHSIADGKTHAQMKRKVSTFHTFIHIQYIQLMYQHIRDQPL